MNTNPTVTEQPIPGGWTEREVVVLGREFRLALPASPDEFSRQMTEASASDPNWADPYWTQLWPASLHLAEAALRSDITSTAAANPATRVLELGCGIGLAGLAALAKGCEMTFSDYVPWAVELALENARLSGFATARGMLLDWRRPSREQFPFILAADVLYDQANHGPLLDVLDSMLAPGGQCWFGDPGRSVAADFLRQAGERGYSAAIYDEQGCEVAALALGEYRLIVVQRSLNEAGIKTSKSTRNY